MVILPGIVDVIFRHKMNWFFRHPYTLPFLAKIVPPLATWRNFTGYNVLYAILSLVFPIVIYILSDRGLTKIVLVLSLAFGIINFTMFVPLDLQLSVQNITFSLLGGSLINYVQIHHLNTGFLAEGTVKLCLTVSIAVLSKISNEMTSTVCLPLLFVVLILLSGLGG
jgi:hypothetical protein